MATRIKNDRRQFLRLSASGMLAASFPDILLAGQNIVKRTATASFKPDVEINFYTRQAYIDILGNGGKTVVQKFYAQLLKGPSNTLFTLNGNYLGPIVNLVKGQKVRVFYTNQLNEPCVIHWHGLHVPQNSDGHPMYSIGPGEKLVYEFEVKNRAGTSFYHSHTHELTAEQVYNGLAGLITVTDEDEQKLELPAGEFDLPLVIQDRSFTANNQLQYVQAMPQRMMGFLGDTILVNGKPNAEFSVKTRAYRFRALNGSNSRIYKLGWDDGTPLTAIGTDGSLLAKPVTKPYIMLAPGERVDLWLDFSGREPGTKLTMFSLPFSGAMPPMYERMKGGMGMMGMGGGLAQGGKFPIATFKISEKVSDSPKLPAQLVPFHRLTESDVDNADNPLPIAISMKPMAPLINGKSFTMDGVMDSDRVRLGSIKKIRIYHDHGMSSEQDHESQEGGMGGGRGMGHMGGRMKGMMGMGGGMGGMKHGGGMGGMGGMGMMLSMAHPIHMHGQQFQILSRKVGGMDGGEGYDTVKDGFIDSGWKDTVLVMPGEEVVVLKPFQDYKGLFLYHCHNLEHEDLGMMRQFSIE